jgi:hypothetical protein
MNKMYLLNKETETVEKNQEEIVKSETIVMEMKKLTRRV